VGDYSAPAFADIDDDGDLDAFIGESGGNTIFFRNTGSASAPAFASSSANPFGLADVGDNAAPTFADIDDDGDVDAFIGNLNSDTIFFRNTGTASAPAFASSSANPFGLTNVVWNATPTFTDVDGDGDLDALIGDRYGDTLFFRNTGNATSPAFASPSINSFGLLDVGSRAAPAFADIDGDGYPDLFIGRSNGDTLFFSNLVSCGGACTPGPLSGCETPGKAQVKLQDNTDPNKRKFMWKWWKGSAVKADFGAPTSTTGVLLCLYDNGMLAMSAAVDPGGTCDGKDCWKEAKTGFKYKSKSGNGDGVTNVMLKEGTGKAGIQVKGKGSSVTLPTLPLSSAEVKVQLVKNPVGGGECWGSTFARPAVKDDGKQFLDKAPD
jgi:hypothetical protein